MGRKSNQSSSSKCCFCHSIVKNDDVAVTCGNCDVWMHLRCRNLPESDEFVAAVASDCVKILCDTCLKTPAKASELAELKTSISAISEQVKLLNNAINPGKSGGPQKTGLTYASVTAKGIPNVDKIVTVGDFASLQEIDKNKRSLVISGVPESSHESDLKKVRSICNYLDPSANMSECFRLGKIEIGFDPTKPKRPRLLKVQFASSAVANSILAVAKHLREDEEFANIYIRRSMSFEERKHCADLRKACVDLNSANNANNIKFVCADGKILKYVNCKAQDDGRLGKGIIDKSFVYNANVGKNEGGAAATGRLNE